MVQTVISASAQNLSGFAAAQPTLPNGGRRYGSKKLGVRKYKRHLHKLWLLQGAMNNEDEDVFEEEDLFPIDPHESSLSKIFSDSLAYNLLLPIADCTEEEEEILYLTLSEQTLKKRK